jgi:hypothetical protein
MTGATGATGPVAPCFAAGTRIATPQGERRVETLQPGDEVLTADGAVEAVRWVGRRRLARLDAHPAPQTVQPVCIAAGAFGPGAPHRDLVLSPGHAVFVEGCLIPAARLINGRTVVQLHWTQVEYFHVELRRHDVLLAEGLAVESYLDCDNRGDFENGGATLTLHPRFAALAHEAACAPLTVCGPVVERVRRRLARRAAALAATAGLGRLRAAGLGRRRD